jgi:hypothetical protein
LALSLCAIVAGLLAFHSSSGSHAFAGIPLQHEAQAASTVAVPTEAAPTADSTAGMASHTVCGAACLAECAIALLACLSLLVLVIVAFFFRAPAIRSLLSVRGPTPTPAAATGFTLPPSLTALCVLRV